MSPPPAEPGEPRRRKLAAAAIAVAVIAAGVSASWLWVKSHTPIHSLVVLPFVDQTSHKDHEWFCAGMTAGLIDSLARVPGLRVIGSDSAFRLQNPAQFGVEALLEGRVQGAGGEVRITVRLKRVSDGYSLWAYTFDRAMRNVGAVEQEIAGTIAKRVPEPGGWKPPKFRRAVSAEANQAYFEGRYWFGRGDPDSLRKAIAQFEKATALDPLFSRAYAWDSISRSYLAEQDAEPPNSLMPGARDSAERSRTLDKDLAEAHVAMGIVMLQYDRDWEGAKREFDRAIALSPSSSLAREWRARWLMAMGRVEDAFAQSESALSFDPLSPRILGDLALQSLALGQSGRAAEFTEKTPGVNPAIEVAALYQSGQKDRAAALFEGYQKSAESAGGPAWLCGAFPGFDPYLQEAQATLHRIEELRNVRFTPADTFAMMAATSGDKDAFFEWADVACDERSPHLAYWRLLPGLPVTDERFAELLGKLNLPTNSAPQESKKAEGK